MSESDSFEQEATEGISEQVDALKGFLEEKGLAGGSPTATGGDGRGEDGGRGTSSRHPEDASFARAESAVESHWTSHGGDAPEHAPVAAHDREAADHAASAGRTTDGGWTPVIAPDGEAMDASGGSSDGSESGQDGGSMS